MSISTLAHLATLLATAATSQPALAPATPPPTTVPQINPGAGTAIVAVLLLFAGLAVVIFIAYRVYLLRLVAGPRRLAVRGKAVILLISFGIGLFAWFTPQVIYSSRKLAELQRQGVKNPREHLEESLTPRDLAVLSTVPQIAAFSIMLVILLLAGDSMASRLGLSLRTLPRGVGAGVLGFFVVFPAVLLGGLVVESLYRHFGFHHPGEHELLKSFGEAHQPGIALSIVLGATICAPIFEEMLFRGHLQTLLRHVLLKLTTAERDEADAAAAFAAAAPLPQAAWLLPPPPPPATDGLIPPPFAIPYLPPPPPDPLPLQAKAWPSWVAIVLTSLVFAVVHPLWMAPLIFLLSIGLGYVYERTGILWASITVHMLFNGSETLIYYLTTLRGH